MTLTTETFIHEFLLQKMIDDIPYFDGDEFCDNKPKTVENFKQNDEKC